MLRTSLLPSKLTTANLTHTKVPNTSQPALNQWDRRTKRRNPRINNSHPLRRPYRLWQHDAPLPAPRPARFGTPLPIRNLDTSNRVPSGNRKRRAAAGGSQHWRPALLLDGRLAEEYHASRCHPRESRPRKIQRGVLLPSAA
jgi:hypothetical protein